MKVVTVSTDTPEEIRDERHLHGLQADMLSDRTLAVTDAFGLRNTAFHTGLPRDSMEALPVPATLLVDATGKVRWVDISQNYQQRTDPQVVLEAMRAVFDQ